MLNILNKFYHIFFNVFSYEGIMMIRQGITKDKNLNFLYIAINTLYYSIAKFIIKYILVNLLY